MSHPCLLNKGTTSSCHSTILVPFCTHGKINPKAQGWVLQKSLEATKPKTGPLKLLAWPRQCPHFIRKFLVPTQATLFKQGKSCASTLHTSVLGCWAWRHRAEETRCRARLFCPPSSSARWGFSGERRILSAKWTIQPVSICCFLCYTGSSGCIFLSPRTGTWQLEPWWTSPMPRQRSSCCGSWPKKVKTSNFSLSTLNEAVAEK